MEGRHILKVFAKLGYHLIFTVLFLLAAWVSITNFHFREDPEYIPGAGPYKMLIVLSDSMKPVFAAGDIIIIDASGEREYKENDIITFWRSRSPHVLLTHRITGIEEMAGRKYYTTRGDANNTEDGVTAGQADILGKYFFKIPFGGYLVNFVHTGTGFVLLIALPLLLVMGYELKRYSYKKRFKMRPARPANAGNKKL